MGLFTALDRWVRREIADLEAAQREAAAQPDAAEIPPFAALEAQAAAAAERIERLEAQRAGRQKATVAGYVGDSLAALEAFMRAQHISDYAEGIESFAKLNPPPPLATAGSPRYTVARPAPAPGLAALEAVLAAGGQGLDDWTDKMTDVALAEARSGAGVRG